jgi:hypothetical protein
VQDADPASPSDIGRVVGRTVGHHENVELAAGVVLATGVVDLRLEERRLVESEWGLSDKGKRARFYRLTTAGRQQLRAETATWRRYVESVARMLNATTAPA